MYDHSDQGVEHRGEGGGGVVNECRGAPKDVTRTMCRHVAPLMLRTGLHCTAMYHAWLAPPLTIPPLPGPLQLLQPQLRGVLKKGETVLDTMTGNWLHHVEWEKGVNKVGWQGKGSSHSAGTMGRQALEMQGLGPQGSEALQLSMYENIGSACGRHSQLLAALTSSGTHNQTTTQHNIK